MENNQSNAFEALCSLASKEGWCWKINCTTCGHMYFRYGIHEILLGKHPESSCWVVSAHHPVLLRGGQPSELGSVPSRWKPWPIEEQRHLTEILVTANIWTVASECTYPDWLGYLGLGLKYSEEAEREARAITKSWAPQLLDLRAHIPHAATLLQNILYRSDRVISWRTLEGLE